MLILYDAVGILADAVGRSLANPTYVEIHMPPLTARWTKLKDDDPTLIPLLEVSFQIILFAVFDVFKCLASVATAMGSSFIPCDPGTSG